MQYCKHKLRQIHTNLFEEKFFPLCLCTPVGKRRALFSLLRVRRKLKPGVMLFTNLKFVSKEFSSAPQIVVRAPNFSKLFKSFSFWIIPERIRN